MPGFRPCFPHRVYCQPSDRAYGASWCASVPDYELAPTNLALLGNQSEIARGETAAAAPLPSGCCQNHRS
jgi:hypothetical protein